MKVLLACLIVALAAPALAWTPYKDVPFNQTVSTRMTFNTTGKLLSAAWPKLTDITAGSVQQVLHVQLPDGGFTWLLTNTSLFALGNTTVTQVHLPVAVTAGSRMAAMAQPGAVALVTPTAITALLCSPSSCKKTSGASGKFGAVTGVAWDEKKEQLWLSASAGAYVWDGSTVSQPSFIASASGFNAVAVDSSSGTVAVCTTLQLFRRSPSGSWHMFWTAGIMDFGCTAIAFDHEGNAWIGAKGAVNIMQPDTAFKRLGPLDGLPYGNISSLASGVQPGEMWMGTPVGVVRYLRGQWFFYSGPRWLPGAAVTSIAVNAANGTAIAVTSQGVARLRQQLWTLADKAAHYATMLSPRHDRFVGFVSDCSLTSFGDVASYQPHPSDNDGLWTSMYVTSQALQYAATGDADAKARAWKHWSALEYLVNVTGIPGYMARSAMPASSSPGSNWHASPVYKGVWWKGDTSSDEVTGHFQAYGMMYDLVAETAEEKARVGKLMETIASGIVKHGYKLLGLDGKRTTWGFWDPHDTNDVLSNFDERGLNAAEIVSYLANTYNRTGNAAVLAGLKNLTDNYDYLQNLINTKITIPDDFNWSDDELLYLSYLPLFRSLGGSLSYIRNNAQLGFDRAWKTIAASNSSFLNIIYGTTGVDEFGLAGAVDDLKQWPWDLVNWNFNNGIRKDVFHTMQHSRGNTPQSVRILRRDERMATHWNTDVYALYGGNGFAEFPPQNFLLPYWMARYYGFITAA